MASYAAGVKDQIERQNDIKSFHFAAQEQCSLATARDAAAPVRHADLEQEHRYCHGVSWKDVQPFFDGTAALKSIFHQPPSVLLL